MPIISEKKLSSTTDLLIITHFSGLVKLLNQIFLPLFHKVKTWSESKVDILDLCHMLKQLVNKERPEKG